MAKIGLSPKDLKRLERILPEYIDKRYKGMNAGNVAEKLKIPLKDVISFLIEKNVLRDEQVDMEFARVILAKNPSLRESIVARIDLSYDKLDRALALRDEKILKEAMGKSEISEIQILFPQIVVFLSLLSLPYTVTVMLCMTMIALVLNGAIERIMPLSAVEITMKMLKN